MRSADIPLGSGTIEGADMTITAKNGLQMEVQVRSVDSPAAASGVVVIESAEITGRNIANAVQVFRKLVEVLGYKYKSPIVRGTRDKKAMYVNEFDLVAFRHNDFRRVPNPSKPELAKYEKVIQNACKSFLRTSQNLCEDSMLEFADLITYAQVWTCNYLGLFELSEADATDSGNEKLLMSYLVQRFGEFRLLLKKRGRSVFVSSEDVSIAFFGAAEKVKWQRDSNRTDAPGVGFAGSEHHHWMYNQKDMAIDSAYIARNNELDTSSVDKRRTSAGKKLDECLNNMAHDEQIAVLTKSIDNTNFHPDARRAAVARLQRHRAGCAQCRALNAA
jgi:hypothetical protein